MAVCEMLKVLVVSHRSESTELLEALQTAGICQVINAEEAAVTKDWPDLSVGRRRPRDLEDLVGRLTRVIAFLKDYREPERFPVRVFSPRTVVDRRHYESVVSGGGVLRIAEQCDQTRAAIERLDSDRDGLGSALAELQPWKDLETPLEEISRLEAAACTAGLIPRNRRPLAEKELAESGAELQAVGSAGNADACVILCFPENLPEVRKVLRSAEFEPVNFAAAPFAAAEPENAGPTPGTVAELIAHYRGRLGDAEAALEAEHKKAAAFAGNLLELQILCDHYRNILDRERVRDGVPATDATVVFEGWVRKADFAELEKVVSKFAASSLGVIEPAVDEPVPVEIENTRAVKPFEVITRLYGMPQRFEVDPTAFLAPFFAIFFALCLTDAGYGIVILAVMVYLARRMQGDTKLMWMLVTCSVFTVAAGAMTGGWFGDTVQQFFPALEPARKSLMWFDPLEKPMMFFRLSLVLGYVQILAGLVIAFVHNLRCGRYTAAVCDQLSWLVMLNCIVLFAAAKAGAVAEPAGRFCSVAAIAAAAAILLFSQRQGGWGERLGMGFYNLFSAIFYVGDVLSYLRLMALGMVTAGLAMAINVIARVVLDVPYGIGVVLMLLVLVGGHAFNLAISGLSAFVHTLRLQYVEFFPKFLVGGGRQFEPLSKRYKYVHVGPTV
jgi:V/A-type H+-transporting ATPase subunit I